MLYQRCTPGAARGEAQGERRGEEIGGGVLQRPRAEKLKAVLDEVYFEKGFDLDVGEKHLGTCYFAKVSARFWARRAWTLTFREGPLLPRLRPTW